MEFNLKRYQKNKVKEVLKTNNFLFLVAGLNQNSQAWIDVEQQLCKLELSYHKINNNSAKKVLNVSTNLGFKNLICSKFFFCWVRAAQNKKRTPRVNVLNGLSLIKFSVFTLKLNKKSYPPAMLKTLKAFHYKKNLSILHQFLMSTLKSAVIIKSEQCDSNT